MNAKTLKIWNCNQPMDRWTDQQLVGNKWRVHCRCVDKRADGWKDGWTDGRTDQWTDGRTHWRAHGLTDKAAYRVACPQLVMNLTKNIANPPCVSVILISFGSSALLVQLVKWIKRSNTRSKRIPVYSAWNFMSHQIVCVGFFILAKRPLPL